MGENQFTTCGSFYANSCPYDMSTFSHLQALATTPPGAPPPPLPPVEDMHAMIPTRVFGAGGMDTDLMESPMYSVMGKTLLQMCTDVQSIPGVSTMEDAALASSQTPCQAKESHHSYLTFQVEDLVRVQLVAIYTFGLYSPPSPPLPQRPPPSLSPFPPPRPPPRPLYSPPAWGDYGNDAKLCVRGSRCMSYSFPYQQVSDTGSDLYAASPAECARGTMRVISTPGHTYQNTFAFPIMFVSEQGFASLPPISHWNAQTQTVVNDAPNGAWCLTALDGCVLVPDPDYNVFTHTSLECSVLQWCTERRGDDTCTINNVNQARNGLCKLLFYYFKPPTCQVRVNLTNSYFVAVYRPGWRLRLRGGDVPSR